MNKIAKIFSALAVLATVFMARPALAAEPFFFIQISDPQFGMYAKDANFTQETANFEFVVANVNRLKPAFVVITGDLVNKGGDAKQIAEYRRIVGKIDKKIPVYAMAGNHDVENEPTPESVAAYTAKFGPDHYTFRYGDFVGIVLDSSVIHSPKNTMANLDAQEKWLTAELEKAQVAGARAVIFQHHPWALTAGDEPDQYFNIPLARRAHYLALFHKYGVKTTFSGHYHRNALARDGDLEMVTTGPVGMPLGGDQSGIRIVIVRDGGIEHKFYTLGQIPNQIDPK